MSRSLRRPLHGLVLSAVSVGLFVGCASPNAAPAPSNDALVGRYWIKGGGSAMSAVKALTDRFTEAHPRVRFDYEDIGSDGGVALTADGTVDLGMISRDLKPTEVGKVETLRVGTSATGVVVNSDNPITNLTRDQLRDIFAGRITNWSQVGGRAEAISVFVREPDSSTRSTFDDFVFGGKSQYTPEAVEVFEKEPMLNAIHGLKSAIGMATVTSSVLSDTGLRVISIDGVAPSPEAIKSSAFPIVRRLYITYRTETLKPAVAAFLEYVRGPEGQRLAASL